jgi:hypothetical protein
MRQVARPSILQYSWQSVAERMQMAYEDTLSEADTLAELVAR